MPSSLAPNGSQTAILLPHKIEVVAVVSHRYQESGSANRPQSWDLRQGGLDIVEVAGGELVKLVSSPMQSVPKPGWILMLLAGESSNGYEWTLYGMSGVNRDGLLA